MSISFHVRSGLNLMFAFAPTESAKENLAAKNAIEKVIINWSSQNNGIKGFIYKIKQLILTIFGWSDWQIAKKTLREIQIKNLDRLIYNYTGIRSITASLPKKLTGLIDTVNAKILGMLIKLNDATFPLAQYKNFVQYLSGVASKLQETLSSQGISTQIINAAFQQLVPYGYTIQQVINFVRPIFNSMGLNI